MKSLVKCMGLIGLMMGVQALDTTAAVETEASAPTRVSVALYDQGFGLVSEVRRLTPAPGLNQIRIGQLPARLDPASVTFVPVAGGTGLRLLEQQFHHDSLSTDRLLRRYLNQEVTVIRDGEAVTGRLLQVPQGDPAQPLILSGTPGAARVLIDPQQIQEIILPDATTRAYLEPTLIWRAEAETAGPQSIRLTYRVEPLDWSVAYDVLLDEEGNQAYFASRVALVNQAGGSFSNATIQLIATERGALQTQRRSALIRPVRDPQPDTPALRYAYGGTAPVFQESVASLSPLQQYALERPVIWRDGETLYVRYAEVESLPVDRFYVYDGVKFDRFQRHRRNDWNYGTESHRSVETHLQFENTTAVGLGQPLPSGAFRLYQRRSDGAVEFVGEDQLLAVEAGGRGSVLLGPARGLVGERERTGYTEVTPLRVYEESFQISLENNTDEPVEIRVVEHLYRWPDFEIVRADAEYTQTADQTIEFRPVLRPGGRRTIHYTVRYSW